MSQFLHGLSSALIGVFALFSWIPFAWIGFKLIQWQRDEAEQAEAKYRTQVERAPAWERIPDYWEKVTPIQLSDDPIADGDFYVTAHEGMGRGNFASVAPNLLAHHRKSGEGAVAGGCYFRKQPANPEELEEAIAAVNASRDYAVRYRGATPQFLPVSPRCRSITHFDQDCPNRQNR